MISLAVLTLLQPSYASENPFGAEWSSVDRRAYGVYTAGWVTGVAGVGVEVLGIATGSVELALIGGMAESAGAPMMAGATLRSRRALAGEGVMIPGALGYASWGLWGGALALGVAAAGAYYYEDWLVLSLASLGCVGTSYGLAVGQNAANRRGRADAGWTSISDDDRVWRVGLAPMHRRGTYGLALRIDR